MVKTIKFNLICDDKPVRTIEDLQNNFSIEDVLGYYHNRLLHRWLEVRGYMDALEEVNDINSIDNMEIIKKLIKIFNVESDENKISEKIYILKYIEERDEKNQRYERLNTKSSEIIKENFVQYEKFKYDVINHNQDMPFLKACCKKLANEFFEIFDKDYYNLIYLMIDECPMFIYVMLTHPKLRKYMLVSELEECASNIKRSNVEKIYDKIMSEEFFNAKNIDAVLGGNVKVVCGPTNEYWKDVVPKNKNVMFIRAGEKVIIRNAGKTGEEIYHEDYMGGFMMLKGLDYKCNDSHCLRYMEV